MKLTHATLLEGLAEGLREKVAPHVADRFASEALRMGIALVQIAGRAGDDAAAIRVAENARMRGLLGEGAALADDKVLAARLSDAAASTDPDLRISNLDTETGRLRLLLIELHCWLEGQTSPPARALDAAIWRGMRDFEMARGPRG